MHVFVQKGGIGRYGWSTRDPKSSDKKRKRSTEGKEERGRAVFLAVLRPPGTTLRFFFVWGVILIS
jgi:hypothetical protein